MPLHFTHVSFSSRHLIFFATWINTLVSPRNPNCHISWVYPHHHDHQVPPQRIIVICCAISPPPLLPTPDNITTIPSYHENPQLTFHTHQSPHFLDPHNVTQIRYFQTTQYHQAYRYRDRYIPIPTINLTKTNPWGPKQDKQTNNNTRRKWLLCSTSKPSSPSSYYSSALVHTSGPESHRGLIIAKLVVKASHTNWLE